MTPADRDALIIEARAIAEAHEANEQVKKTHAAYRAATQARALAFAALRKLGWGTSRIGKEFGMTRSRAQQIVELAARPERRQP